METQREIRFVRFIEICLDADGKSDHLDCWYLFLLRRGTFPASFDLSFLQIEDCMQWPRNRFCCFSFAIYHCILSVLNGSANPIRSKRDLQSDLFYFRISNSMLSERLNSTLHLLYQTLHCLLSSVAPLVLRSSFGQNQSSTIRLVNTKSQWACSDPEEQTFVMPCLAGNNVEGFPIASNQFTCAEIVKIYAVMDDDSIIVHIGKSLDILKPEICISFLCWDLRWLGILKCSFLLNGSTFFLGLILHPSWRLPSLMSENPAKYKTPILLQGIFLSSGSCA